MTSSSSVPPKQLGLPEKLLPDISDALQILLTLGVLKPGDSIQTVLMKLHNVANETSEVAGHDAAASNIIVRGRQIMTSLGVLADVPDTRKAGDLFLEWNGQVYTCPELQKIFAAHTEGMTSVDQDAKTLLHQEYANSPEEAQIDGLIANTTGENPLRHSLAILSPSRWKDSNLKKYAGGHTLCMVNTPSMLLFAQKHILPSLPAQVLKSLEDSKLENVSVNFGHFALLFVPKDNDEHRSFVRTYKLVTESQLIQLEIPAQFRGRNYLDVLSDGKPLLRTNYGLNDEQRCFFDGTRFMTHKTMGTCAPRPEISPDGSYRVQVERGGSGDSRYINNGAFDDEYGDTGQFQPSVQRLLPDGFTAFEPSMWIEN